MILIVTCSSCETVDSAFSFLVVSLVVVTGFDKMPPRTFADILS